LFEVVFRKLMKSRERESTGAPLISALHASRVHDGRAPDAGELGALGSRALPGGEEPPRDSCSSSLPKHPANPVHHMDSNVA
jgi:hypothetical protein